MTPDSSSAPLRASEDVEARGHLVDSQLLSSVFDEIVQYGGAFEVLHFELGRTNEDFSHVMLRVSAADQATLDSLLQELIPLGCTRVVERDAALQVADRDGCAPESFYSTTNHQTHVRHAGRWMEVAAQRMDAAIVVADDGAACRKLRDLRAGDRVVCGVDGIRVTPPFRDRDRLGFAFMANETSSERRVEVSVAKIADVQRDMKRRGLRTAFIVGPVVVHTGGVEPLCELIRGGFVDVLLAGNAVAVHDVEAAMFGTSLGVSLETGIPVRHGHQHHMRAINAIRRAGSLRAAVETGVLRSGIMFECVRRQVPYVLAGSIRDDGPLPDTVMDLVRAQDEYAAALVNVGMIVVLGSMLHGIGVGNMTPSWVRLVCVDINPAVVTKLSDRGSAQSLGLVTDVGLFLQRLAAHLGTGRS